LEAQIACNNVLLPRITDIASKLADPNASIPPTKYWTNLVEQLEKNPSRDCPPGNDPTKIEQTYDGMLLSLFNRVTQETKDKLKGLSLQESEKEERLGKELAAEMAKHVKQLGEMIEKDKKELEEEIAEQKKKITTEDIHEGWESKVCSGAISGLVHPLTSCMISSTSHPNLSLPLYRTTTLSNQP
jgi:cell division cycle protein 37